MEFHERLTKLLDERKVRNTQFVKELGVTATTTSNWRMGRAFPPPKFFELLKVYIPDYNANWLWHGEGEMFLPDHEPPTPPAKKNSMGESRSQRKVKPNHVTYEQGELAAATTSELQTILNKVIERLERVENVVKVGVREEVIESEPERIRAMRAAQGQCKVIQLPVWQAKRA